MSYRIVISNTCNPEVADYSRCAADGKTYKEFMNWMAEYQPQLRCGIAEYTIDPQSLDNTAFQPTVIFIEPEHPEHENGWRLPPDDPETDRVDALIRLMVDAELANQRLAIDLREMPHLEETAREEARRYMEDPVSTSLERFLFDSRYRRAG